MSGPPTQREFDWVVARLRKHEEDIEDLKSWKSREQGIATILGFLGGLVAATIVTAVAKAIFG